MVNNKVVQAVELVVSHLAHQRYDEIVRLTGGVRLSAQQMRDAVADYGAPIVMPTSFDQIDAIRVAGSDPPAWSVRFDLWTRDEQPSDLSLEMTVVEDTAAPRIEVDNIHVL